MERRRVRSDSLLKRLRNQLRRLFGRKTEPREPEPDDPYAYRAAPLRRPPRDRSGAAVADLDED